MARRGTRTGCIETSLLSTPRSSKSECTMGTSDPVSKLPHLCQTVNFSASSKHPWVLFTLTIVEWKVHSYVFRLGTFDPPTRASTVWGNLRSQTCSTPSQCTYMCTHARTYNLGSLTSKLFDCILVLQIHCDHLESRKLVMRKLSKFAEQLNKLSLILPIQPSATRPHPPTSTDKTDVTEWFSAYQIPCGSHQHLAMSTPLFVWPVTWKPQNASSHCHSWRSKGNIRAGCIQDSPVRVRHWNAASPKWNLRAT